MRNHRAHAGGPSSAQYLYILALVVGEAINARAASRISAIGREIQTAGVLELRFWWRQTLLMSVARYLP